MMRGPGTLAPGFALVARSFFQILHGPLHSVRYTHQRLNGPNEWRCVAGEFKLH